MTAFHFLITAERLLPIKVSSFETRAAAETAAPPTTETRKSTVCSSEENLKGLGGPVLVLVFNRVSAKPVARFATLEDAARRTWAALNSEVLPMDHEVHGQNRDGSTIVPLPATGGRPGSGPVNRGPITQGGDDTQQETTTMPKKNGDKKAAKPRGTETGAKRGTKMSAGKPAGLVADFRPVRPGTDRATVLQLMDGDHTTASIAKAIENTDRMVLAHAYCLARDCGIGYRFNETGKLEALFPGSKTLEDAIKAPVEKKPVEKKAKAA